MRLAEVLGNAANKIQRQIHTYIARKEFISICKAAIQLHSCWRGWQPGIQEGAADWDENWDNFEDEGFTFVKELTLDVQNVIAPPKPKSSPLQNKASSAKEGVTDVSSSNADQKSETSNADGKSETFNAGRKSETLPTGEERIPDDAHSEEGVTRNPPDSPTPALGSPSKKFQNSPSRKNFNADGSPHAAETLRLMKMFRGKS